MYFRASIVGPIDWFSFANNWSKKSSCTSSVRCTLLFRKPHVLLTVIAASESPAMTAWA